MFKRWLQGQTGQSVMLLIVIVALSNWIVAAQEIENPITWSLKAEAPAIAHQPGAQFRVLLTAKIETSWHLYSSEQPPGGPIPTRISLPADQPFKLNGEIETPVPRIELDPNFNLETLFFEEEAIFTIPVTVVADATSGKQDLKINVSFQTCNGQRCLPPRLVKLTTEVIINGPAPTRPVTTTTQAPTTKAPEGTTTASVGRDPGVQVPDFAFTDFNGKPRKFSEFRGKFVLLDFWATWCKPCLADIPHLKELYARYQPREFEILGLDSETLGQDDADADPEFAKQSHERAKTIVSTRGVTWPQATSQTAVPVAVKIFGVESLPTKILIDPQGKIVALVKESAELDRLLASLLAGK